MDHTKMKAVEGPGDYSLPIARTGEAQFACIVRNRSGIDAGLIDFGMRSIDHLCDADQQAAINSVFAVYEEWCRNTGKKALRDPTRDNKAEFLREFHAS